MYHCAGFWQSGSGRCACKFFFTDNRSVQHRYDHAHVLILSRLENFRHFFPTSRFLNTIPANKKPTCDSQGWVSFDGISIQTIAARPARTLHDLLIGCRRIRCRSALFRGGSAFAESGCCALKCRFLLRYVHSGVYCLRDRMFGIVLYLVVLAGLFFKRTVLCAQLLISRDR